MSLRPEHRFVVGCTLVALAALVPATPGPLRALAAVTFLLVVPGLAWVHTLPVRGLVETAAVAVALSLAVDVLVAEALLFVGLPGPVPSALVLAAVATAGVAFAQRSKIEVPA
jgi:hypothetical protein